MQRIEHTPPIAAASSFWARIVSKQYGCRLGAQGYRGHPKTKLCESFVRLVSHEQ